MQTRNIKTVNCSSSYQLRIEFLSFILFTARRFPAELFSVKREVSKWKEVENHSQVLSEIIIQCLFSV